MDNVKLFKSKLRAIVLETGIGFPTEGEIIEALAAAGLEVNPEGTARERDKLKSAADPSSKTWDHETVGTFKGDPDLWEKLANYAEKRIEEGEEWMTISMRQYAGLLRGMHIKKQITDRYFRTASALTEGEG